MATRHCNIQKIKTSEDTLTSPRLVFDEFMRQIKSVIAYKKEKMAVDLLRSAASPMQVSKTGALWIQGRIIKPKKRECRLILWFVLKRLWPNWKLESHLPTQVSGCFISVSNSNKNGLSLVYLQISSRCISVSPKHSNPWSNSDKKAERRFQDCPRAYNSQWLIM